MTASQFRFRIPLSKLASLPPALGDHHSCIAETVQMQGGTCQKTCGAFGRKVQGDVESQSKRTASRSGDSVLGEMPCELVVALPTDVIPSTVSLGGRAAFDVELWISSHASNSDFIYVFRATVLSCAMISESLPLCSFPSFCTFVCSSLLRCAPS